MKHDATLRVIYGDTDQMGVVYYANYLRYFELGRMEFFRALGGTYTDWEKAGVFLPVIEANVSYKAPARYEDLLTIRTWLSEVRRASLVFQYEVYRQGTEALLTTGRTAHACITTEGKVTRFPEDLLAFLKR